MQTFVMMTGELNYQSNFLEVFLRNELPFDILTYYIFVQFVLLVPILLMNLMVNIVCSPLHPYLNIIKHI